MDATNPEITFVARKRELEKLERLLGRALQSQMQVAMVTGDPGVGKSTLIEEFINRAADAHEDLAVAYGMCNSRTGAGDAYLPFRDILVSLTTPPDPEPAPAGPSAPKPKAKTRHTRQILRAGAEALLDIAPDIIGVFVPGGALLGKFVGKVARSAADKTGALTRIDADPASEAPKSVPDLSAPALDEGKIQQQYTAFLRVVTARQPLILVLDDLQWADTASINLLFHLVRELKDSQLMIIGAYRENDIAFGRDNNRHPIEPALNEVKRYFGDVWIELDKASADDRHSLLDALLDVEPNAYSAEFRNALYAKTAGHPLFTLELLRDLQERGDLVKDEHGQWRPGNDIDWSELPARVEGVVSERVSRLEAPLREILSVAAVAGSSFFAQVVGKILNQAERLILRDLSRELEKRHRLIVEQGEVKAGRAILSRYTFANTMLQQYLYDQLGSGERRLWHGDIGDALEGLLGAKADDFAIQLAHHFDLAGDDEKAISYLVKIGDKAMQVSAFAQARTAFERALEHMRDADLETVGTVTRASLQYRLADVCHRTGSLGTAIDLLEVCLADSRAANPALASNALTLVSRIRRQQGRNDDALAASQEAVTLAEAAQDKSAIAAALRGLGLSQWQKGEGGAGRATMERSLATYRELNDRRGVASALGELGVVAFSTSDLTTAATAFNDAVKVFREIGDRHLLAIYLGNVGVVAEEQGDLAAARKNYSEAMLIARELGTRKEIAIGAVNLGDLHAREGAVADARTAYRLGLEESHGIGAQWIILAALRGLAWVRLKSGDAAGAAEWLGLVTRHPASNDDVRRAAGPVLAEVATALGEAALSDALGRGERLDLDKTARDALAQ